MCEIGRHAADPWLIHDFESHDDNHVEGHKLPIYQIYNHTIQLGCTNEM